MKKSLMRITNLEEWRREAYDNQKLYKERIKRIHDRALAAKEVIKPGDQVMVYNSRLRLIPGKLRTHWEGPFSVVQVYDYGVVELKGDSGTFKVNAHQIKVYYGDRLIIEGSKEQACLLVELEDVS